MPSVVPAKRGQPYITYVALIDAASGKLFKANPTLAAGDVTVSIDGATAVNITTLPTVTPAGGKRVKISLSGAETTGDTISVLFSDVTGAEWNDQLVVIDTALRQLDDLAFPTVSGRSLDVTATGAAGIDWANVENPTTALALSATTISSAQVVASVTGAVGSVTGSVGSVTGSVGSVTGSVGSVTGNVGGNVNGSVAIVGPGAISSGSFALGAINAAAIAADAIGASELAADAVAEIADQVWDEVLAGHLTAGSTGAALNGAGSAGDPWLTALPGAYGAGTAGNIVGNRLDVAVSTRLAPTVPGRTLDVTATGEAGLDWANIGAPTTVVALTNTTISAAQIVASVTGPVGSVTGSVGGNVTGSVGSVAANGITAASIATGAFDADALATDAVVEIVNGVWNEPIAGHLAGGSTGAALNAGAATGTDPWTTPLPGAYGAGTAGNILGTNLNATVSSRATQTSVDAVKADTAAIKLKTDNLPVDPADESNTQARFTTLDAAVAAIAAKTNALPTDPADNSDILGAIAALPPAPSALTIADTLLNRDMAAVSDTNARSPLNALRFLRNKWSTTEILGQLVVKKENDSTTAWQAPYTVDAAAPPITGVDPT